MICFFFSGGDGEVVIVICKGGRFEGIRPMVYREEGGREEGEGGEGG